MHPIKVPEGMGVIVGVGSNVGTSVGGTGVGGGSVGGKGVEVGSGWVVVQAATRNSTIIRASVFFIVFPSVK